MSRLRTLAAELVGLFVDDGSLALLALLWVVLVGLGLRLAGLPAGWAGLALFVGLAALLAASVRRGVRG